MLSNMGSSLPVAGGGPAVLSTEQAALPVAGGGPAVLSTEQAAAYVGLSRSTLEKSRVAVTVLPISNWGTASVIGPPTLNIGWRASGSQARPNVGVERWGCARPGFVRAPRVGVGQTTA